MSIVHPSVRVITHLERARSALFIDLKRGAPSDDEQIGTTWMHTGRNAGG